MTFFSKFIWQRPDCRPLVEAIADMPSESRKRPDVTVLAGELHEERRQHLVIGIA